MCLQREDSGRGVQAGQPPVSSAAKASFPKKEPFEAAVASQALRPCHVEKEDVSPTAWPRLPLTPPVSTHCGPYPAVYTRKSVAPKPAPGAGGPTQSQCHIGAHSACMSPRLH